MDIAFVVSLPSDLERFAPVARRLPGCSFVLAPGRWPSRWLDSRQWTLAELRRQRRRPAPPRRRISLLVAGHGVPARSLSAWAAPGARLLRVDAADPRFGDPRLDAAFDIGAAMRARHALGLGSERPLLLVATAEPERHLRRFAQGLASLRSDHDLLVAPSEQARLRGSGPPSALRGPGIGLRGDGLAWADCLAMADCVLGDDLPALVDAMRVGKPAMLLHDTPPAAPQFTPPKVHLLRRAVDLLPVIVEPQDFARHFAQLDAHWREQATDPVLVELRSRCRGDSARRMAAALARVHARLGIDRVLDSLSV